MTAAFIEGAQGDKVGQEKILVHLKHWPGSGPHEDGVDQIGSDTNPNYLVELVCEGVIPISRIDDAVSRILKWHFSLGLFENPYVDPQKALAVLQSEENEAFGMQCQMTSNVLLTNNGVLPLKEGAKVFVDGIDAAVAADYGTVVDNPEDADVIIYRTDFSKETGGFGFGPFGGGPAGPGAPAARPGARPGARPAGPAMAARPRMRGPADWKIGEKIDDIDIALPVTKAAKLAKYAATGKPVVADLNTTGSSCVITPEVKAIPAALMLSFDPTDKAVMEVLFGKFSPVGKLSFEIPSSMDAVREQLEDKPFASVNPSFEYGFGLTY